MSPAVKFETSHTSQQGIIRWADGSLPTAEELNELVLYGYIFSSVRDTTNEYREGGHCTMCNRALT